MSTNISSRPAPAVPDRVRRQLVDSEEHVNRQVRGPLCGRRARRDPSSQQVQRGGVEVLVDLDHSTF